MEIQIDSKLLDLITTTGKDVSEAISEALNLWLKEKLTICPITRDFCKDHKPCNECHITKGMLLLSIQSNDVEPFKSL